MQLAITFRNFDASEALKDHTRDRLERLVRNLDRACSAHVVLSLERHLHHADLTLSTGPLVLRRDRSYLFGDHRGRWSVVAGLLLPDGEYTRWGAGALDAANGRLTFHSSGPRFAVSAALVRVEPGKVLLTRAQP